MSVKSVLPMYPYYINICEDKKMTGAELNQTNARKKKQQRLCLKCQKMFNSLGVGNRICDMCSRKNEKVYNGIDLGGSIRREGKKL